MILIDSRTGSKEFLLPIRQLVHAGTDVELISQMPGGDFVFEGNLPEGRGLIAIERKTVDDLISSMTEGRLSDHQLPELQKFDRAFLLVEGFYRPEPGTGRLKGFGRERRIMYSAVNNYLYSLSLNCGLRTIRSNSKDETAHMIVNLYNLLQKKRHWSHVGYYDPIVYATKPKLRDRWLSAIEGIGNVRIKPGKGKFKNAGAIARASLADWEEITGSSKIALKIFQEIHGR